MSLYRITSSSSFCRSIVSLRTDGAPAAPTTRQTRQPGGMAASIAEATTAGGRRAVISLNNRTLVSADCGGCAPVDLDVPDILNHPAEDVRVQVGRRDCTDTQHGQTVSYPDVMPSRNTFQLLSREAASRI